jgi:hypothetical protein
MDAFDRLLAKGKQSESAALEDDPFERLLAKRNAPPEPAPIQTEPAPAQSEPPKERQPSDDYAISTATTPQERGQEAKKVGKEAFRAERESDTAGAVGYGLARGASLGAVDRLVGLGTAIGETMASTDQNPADPKAYEKGRMSYLQDEEETARGNRIAYGIGSVGGSIAPSIALSPLSLASHLPKAKPIAQLGARMFDSGVQGGIAGALNTESDDPLEMAKGGAKGFALGAGTQATLGELARKTIRGAPKREIDKSLREVVESDAGVITSTQRQKLHRDIKDVRDVLGNDKDLREAMRLPAEQALEKIKPRVDASTAGQADRYTRVDTKLDAKSPYTLGQVIKDLEDQDELIGNANLELVTDSMKRLRASALNYFAPRWAKRTGQAVGPDMRITTSQLRDLVSSAQGTAEATMGSINGTNAAKVPGEVSKLANQVLENRLDKAAAAGLVDDVAAIRESDRLTSAYLGLKKALEQRGVKESLQDVGLSTKLKNAGGAMEDSAAAGLAFTGNIPAAVALKARRPIVEGAQSTMRAINDKILAPIQRAAEAGKTWAEVSRIAAEVGAPQGLARYAFDRYSQKPYKPDLTPPEIKENVAPASQDFRLDTRTR